MFETFFPQCIYPSPAPIGSPAPSPLFRMIWIIDAIREGGLPVEKQETRWRTRWASGRLRPRRDGRPLVHVWCPAPLEGSHRGDRWQVAGEARWRRKRGDEPLWRVGATRFLSFPRSSREEFALFAVDLNRVAHVPASRWEKKSRVGFRAWNSKFFLLRLLVLESMELILLLAEGWLMMTMVFWLIW